MNILYKSVHHILEDDEVRLFQSLGHNVCCFGVNSPAGALQPFRDPIKFNERERNLYDCFEKLGGKGRPNDESFFIPAEFVDLFDVVIVMHDINFILAHWPVLSRRPVVWRTIGQELVRAEVALKKVREEGLIIVRYSPTEQEIPGFIGEDVLIRFAKSPIMYSNWSGTAEYVLTFSNFYEQRYPLVAAAYRTLGSTLPMRIGGMGNDGISGTLGFLSLREQIEQYRACGAYLYGHGLEIPYTLNFIEAFMTGAPVVVYAPLDQRGAYLEVDRLIVDGDNGFVCRDIDSTERRLRQLLTDGKLASNISSRGRETAIELFAEEKIAEQWRMFFTKLMQR